MTIGEQIRNKREEMNLSQEELAERVGVSRQAVSKWEGNLSVPRGVNRDTLCELLSISLPDGGEPSSRHFLTLAGWLVAALLLLCVGWLWAQRGEAQAGPALQSVHFYDTRQEPVAPEAGWYATNEIESILVQWEGATPPESIQLFFTPAGTETTEETELLTTRVCHDGESCAVPLSAAPLHRESLMGHLRLQLNFPQEQTVVSDDFNVIYQP